MKKILSVVVISVVVVAGAVYYIANKNDSNSYNGTSDSSQTSSTNSGSQSEGDKAPQATNKVTITNFAFSPASITVTKGTTVTWTNQDSTPHTVTETDGQKGPDSDNLQKGQSYSFTFDTVGTFKYHCALHPDMTGTVTVTE